MNWTLFFVEAVVLCAVFHLGIYLVIRYKPEWEIYSYPPAITQRWIELGKVPVKEVPPLSERLKQKLPAAILMATLFGGGDIYKKRTIRFPFSGTRLQRLAYAVLQRYASFVNKRVDSGRWKNTWKFAVNPEGHKNGISMPLIELLPVKWTVEKKKYFLSNLIKGLEFFMQLSCIVDASQLGSAPLIFSDSACCCNSLCNL